VITGTSANISGFSPEGSAKVSGAPANISGCLQGANPPRLVGNPGTHEMLTDITEFAILRIVGDASLCLGILRVVVDTLSSIALTGNIIDSINFVLA